MICLLKDSADPDLSASVGRVRVSEWTRNLIGVNELEHPSDRGLSTVNEEIDVWGKVDRVESSTDSGAG